LSEGWGWRLKPNNVVGICTENNAVHCCQKISEILPLHNIAVGDITA